MEHTNFDQFVLAVGEKTSRRSALRTLAAAAIGGGGAIAGFSSTEAARRSKPECCPDSAPSLCILTCTNLMADDANCGACGNACPAGSTCVYGVCTCPAGTTSCGGACIDLTSDPLHCGTCGSPCQFGTCQNGSCAECETASDCPGPDWECDVATCESGECGFSRLSSGTVLLNQVQGDCKLRVCGLDGGSIIQINDDADLPDDSNECTANICASGSPSHPPLEAGVPCSQGGGSVCDGNGHCVPCNSTSDCPGGQPCIANTCQIIACGNSLHCGEAPDCYEYQCTAGICQAVPEPEGYTAVFQIDGDCRRHVCDGTGGITSVPWDVDAPYDPYNECRVETCSSGTPVTLLPGPETSCLTGGGIAGTCDGFGHCFVPKQLGEWCAVSSECISEHCVGGVCCESACDATCLSCLSAYNGIRNGSCLPITAGANPFQACPGDEICDGNGQCVQCLTLADCLSGQTCSAGACIGTPQCQSAADCGMPNECHEFQCIEGACNHLPLPLGSPVANQIAGDCRRDMCDGSGGVTWEQDDADLPDDFNQCTIDYCALGNPVFEWVSNGTACNQHGGSVCMDGQCVAP